MCENCTRLHLTNPHDREVARQAVEAVKQHAVQLWDMNLATKNFIVAKLEKMKAAIGYD